MRQGQGLSLLRELHTFRIPNAAQPDAFLIILRAINSTYTQSLLPLAPRNRAIQQLRAFTLCTHVNELTGSLYLSDSARTRSEPLRTT
jgi:hypothetical protein